MIFSPAALKYFNISIYREPFFCLLESYYCSFNLDLKGRNVGATLAVALLTQHTGDIVEGEVMHATGDRPRILVAEDDIGIRQVLCVFLEHSGFEVRAASDGQEAISLILEFRPHLIVLDLMMQPVSGWEVLNWLRENCQALGNMLETALPMIPVLVLTALTPLKEQVHGFEAGAVEYMTKPTQPSAIVKRIRNILSLSVEQRAMLQRRRIDERRGILERLYAPSPDEFTY